MEETIVIDFKTFNIRVREEESDGFFYELSELCRKYADDDYYFTWRREE